MNDFAMKTIEVDGATKYTINFPLTDEQGQPLLDRAGKARVTHLIADSAEELITKMATSNLEVSRALDRSNRHIETLKSKRPTPRAVAPDLKAKPLSQEETIQVGLDIQDPRKAAAAVEKMVESRIGPVAGEVERQRQTLDQTAKVRLGREFFSRHKDDLADIAANGSMLAKWITENELDWTLDNLEIAFVTLGDRLVRPVPPRNAAPAEPAPGNDAPGNEEPNPGTPPPPQRRAPVGGIRDSQASARPGASAVLTKQQALDMLYKDPRKYEAWMRDPEKNAILNRALAGR